MIWIIPGIVVAVLLIVKTMAEEPVTVVDKFFVVISFVIMGVLVTLIPNFIGSMVLEKKFLCTEITTEEVLSNQNIYSAVKGSEHEGSFVLGTGHIKEENYYVYFADTENGLLLQKVPAYNTYIKMSDEEVPHIEIKESTSQEVYEIPLKYKILVSFFPLGGSPETKKFGRCMCLKIQ